MHTGIYMKLFCLSLFLFLFSSLSAQQKMPMSIEDMYDIRTVNSGRISGDGQKLLFSVTEYFPSAGKTSTHLWVKDLYQNRNAYKITFEEIKYLQPGWGPDGKTVSFLSNKEGRTTQLYLMELSKGKITRITSHAASIKSYYWLSQDRLLFLSDEGAAEDDPLVSRSPYFYDEDRSVSSVWEYNIKTKKERRVTGPDISVRTFKPSPDLKSLAVTAAPSARPDDDIKIEIYLFNLDNYSSKQITRNNIIEKQLGWSPDGSFLTFVSDANEKLETYYQESIFRVDISGKNTVDLLKDFPYQVIDHQWDQKNKIIYFIANKGVTQQLFSYSFRNKKVTPHTSVKGVIRSFVLDLRKNRILLQMSDPENPDDFYLTDRGKWKIKRVTYSNPQLSKYALGKYQVVYWKSSDGTEIEGILIFPHNHDMKKRYPLIVQLHGGPNASYQLNFGFSWVTCPNVLTGKDYVLFQPNYRGSAGYGDKFMRSIIGDFFALGYEDIITGVEHLVRNGVADHRKLAITGFSAGAHFTNWVITHTDRFQVASSGAGAANWLSFYAQNEVPYLREIWLGGNPYENIDKLVKQSPITYVKRVKTPTFFYCGEKDNRVPFAQTLEMWRGVKRNNTPTKFLSLPGEPHGINSLKNQILKLKSEIEWIDRYMK